MKQLIQSLARILIASFVGLISGIVLILLTMWLAGCTTSNSQTTKSNQQYLKEIENLKYRINYVEYESINKFCFSDLDTCYIKAIFKCNDKMSCINEASNLCWKIHETCIINNYRRWKSLYKTTSP